MQISPTFRGKNNIKQDLIVIRREHMDRIHLAQYRVWWRALVNKAMNLRVPSSTRNVSDRLGDLPPRGGLLSIVSDSGHETQDALHNICYV
jgi:hypothetical protein